MYSCGCLGSLNRRLTRAVGAVRGTEDGELAGGKVRSLPGLGRVGCDILDLKRLILV